MENRESTFLPGEVFGAYKIVRLLGKGGMGEVYLVEHARTACKFALKIMTPPDGKDGNEWRRRFAHEAEFAMNIVHKSLVGVYDVGEDPDTHLCYIIMEYVPGGTLSDKLKEKGKFDVKEAVAIAAQVAAALDVAHKEGIVHRDIKPDNIMFDADGTPKIADLGIAKFDKSEETTTVTKTGAIIGTPAYMSPEQMMDSHHVDARADIYSLGIVLYEMLTGMRPNADSTIVALLAKAVNGEELPDVREMRPEVSAAVAYVLSRLVAPKPEDRPNSALEAANLLQNAATGNFKVPKEYRRNRALAERARKRRRRFAIIGSFTAATLAIAAGIYLIVTFLFPPEPKTVTKVVEKTVVTNATREVRITHAPDFLRENIKKYSYTGTRWEKNWTNGCLFFGKIQLEGREDVDGITAWVHEIKPDGMFASAMCSNRKNLVFECQGYERLVVPIPEAQNKWSDEIAVDLGTLTMKRMERPSERILEFVPELPDGVDRVRLRVTLRNQFPTGWDWSYLRPSETNVYYGEIENGKRFVLEGCIPQAHYTMEITGDGCARYSTNLVCNDDGSLDLGHLQILPIQAAYFATKPVGSKEGWVLRKVLVDGSNCLDVAEPVSDGGSHKVEIGNDRIRFEPYCEERNAVGTAHYHSGTEYFDMGEISQEEFSRREKAGTLPPLKYPTPVKNKDSFLGPIFRPGHVYVVRKDSGSIGSPFCVAIAFVSLENPSPTENVVEPDDISALAEMSEENKSDRHVRMELAPENLRLDVDWKARNMDKRSRGEKGCHVFCKLELEGGGDVGKVSTSMRADRDGIFFTSLRSSSNKILFECHGYERIEIAVSEAQEPWRDDFAVDLGTIRMRKLDASSDVILELVPILPPGVQKAEVELTMNEYRKESFDWVRRQNNGKVVVSGKIVSSGEKFVLSGCLPSAVYSLYVKAPGCITYKRIVEMPVKAGVRDLGEISLVPAKPAVIATYDNATGAWTEKIAPLETSETILLPGSEKYARNPPSISLDIPVKGKEDDVLWGQYGDGNARIRDVVFRDLGKMSLEEFKVMVKFGSVPAGDFVNWVHDSYGRLASFILKSGHVYKISDERNNLEHIFSIVSYPAKPDEIKRVNSLAAKRVEKEQANEVQQILHGGYKWLCRIDGGNATILSPGGAPCVGKLAVPEKLGQYKVTAINAFAFVKCDKLTEVSIPEGVASIGDRAFDECNSIRRISLPKSLKDLHWAAFRLCTSLERIDVPNDNPSFRSIDGALYSKDGKTLLTYPKNRKELRLGRGVANLNHIALAHSKLKNVIVPEGVVYSGAWEFEACDNLEAVEFPKSLVEMCDWTFKDCKSLKKVVFRGNAPNHGKGVFLNVPENVVVEVPRNSTGWNGDGSTALPAKWPVGAGENAREIRYIGESAEEAEARRRKDGSRGGQYAAKIGDATWYYTLEVDGAVLWRGKDEKHGQPCVEPIPKGKIVVPDEIDGHRVVALGALAFFECDEMTQIMLPKGLKRIGNRCFLHCHALEAIDFPDGVESVGMWAFNQCWNLKRANIKNCGDFETQGVFTFCPKLEKFEVSASNKTFKVVDGSLYSRDGKRFAAFAGAGRICNVAKGVEAIDDYVFCGSMVERVFFPASVKSMGDGVFVECKGLKKVRFAGSAPMLSGPAWRIFNAASDDAVIEVKTGSEGWGGIVGVSAWPESNPRKVVYVEPKGKEKRGK